MRIIGGKLKGKPILPPMGYGARPTTDFAREGLFNVLDNEYEFEDLQVLDLFGGTGAISYEFASRGAARVYCVEMNRDHAAFIRREAARLGLDNVTAVHANVFDFLPIWAGHHPGQGPVTGPAPPRLLFHPGARRRVQLRGPSAFQEGKDLRPSPF